MTEAVKAVDPGPKKCPMCGCFMALLVEPNEFNCPAGWYCKPCGHHPGQKNKIRDWLSNSLIEMLKQSPLNPVVRSQVHATALVPVPDELKDYEAIRRWFEFSLEPLGGFNQSSNAREREMYRTGLRTPVAPNEAFAINCSYRERENGTCHYWRTNTGNGDYAIPVDDLRQMAQTVARERGPMKTLYDRVQQWFDDQVRDEPPETENENEETDDHDSDGRDRVAVELNRARLEERVNEWLYRNYPDIYQAIYYGTVYNTPQVPAPAPQLVAQPAAADEPGILDDDED